MVKNNMLVIVIIIIVIFFARGGDLSLGSAAFVETQSEECPGQFIMKGNNCVQENPGTVGDFTFVGAFR